MKRVVEFSERNFKLITIFQIAICIIVTVIISCQPESRREVKFNEKNLLGGTISADGYACFNETDKSYGIVLETTTGKIKKGRYKVRVEYETGYDDNGFIVQALRQGNVLNEDIGNEKRTITLKSYHNNQEVHAWLKKDSDLRIAIHFCGGGYLQIKKILLYQVPDYTPVVLLILCFAFLDFKLYETVSFTVEERKRRRYIRAGIVGIVLLSSIPLLDDYNISGHDYKYHVYCMEGIAEGLLSGQFPVRIMPNWWNEFGDGAPLFYSHLLLYVPAVIILLGYTIQTAYKCYIVLVNLLTAWIAYKCFLKISNNARVALLGAFLYSLSLYRLIDIYVRCAVGEYTALTFLPLILLGIYYIEEEGWIYMALGLTGCIQSHALVCVMVAFFFILFSIVKMRWILKKQVFFNFCKAGIVSFLGNLWFLFPFLNMYGMKRYKINTYDVGWKLEEKGVAINDIFKLFLSGIGESSFVMGLPLLLGLALSAWMLVVFRKKDFKEMQNRKLKELLIISVCFALISIVLSMNFIPYSKLGNIHEIINKLINTFEFPFRFMGIASLLSVSAIISAFALWKVDLRGKETKRLRGAEYIAIGSLVMLVIIGTMLSSWNLAADQSFHVKHSEFYTIQYIQDADKWLPMEADRNEVSHTLLKSTENIMVSDYEKEYTNIAMKCINGDMEEGYIDVPLFFYPCYKAKDKETGEILPLTYGENARIRIILPPGYQGTILLGVSERKLWRIAESISIFSIFVIIFWRLRTRMRRKVNNNKESETYEIFNHNSKL